MNTKQKWMILSGLLLVTLFIVFEPIRYQNPFHLPVIDSMADLSNQASAKHLAAPDTVKNYVAAGLVALATLFGLYYVRDRHSRVNDGHSLAV